LITCNLYRVLTCAHVWL